MPRVALRARLAALLACLLPPSLLTSCRADDWATRNDREHLVICYGAGGDFPQYGVIALRDSYLRLVPTRDSGWGTSVVLMPCFWQDGKYHQGVPVTVDSTNRADGRLVVRLSGKMETLTVALTVTLSPPADGILRAEVRAKASGDLRLDARPGEAFKPVMLSSMRIDATRWDASKAVVDGQEIALPERDWILHPPKSGRQLGFVGGTSEWKKNSPTVLIDWGGDAPITGWVTRSADPNDDNLSLWPGFDRVIPEWRYTITAQVARP